MNERKDWADAFRESLSGEEARPSAGGWETVRTRRRRAAARRRSVLVAALALIPFIGAVTFRTWTAVQEGTSPDAPGLLAETVIPAGTEAIAPTGATETDAKAPAAPGGIVSVRTRPARTPQMQASSPLTAKAAVPDETAGEAGPDEPAVTAQEGGPFMEETTAAAPEEKPAAAVQDPFAVLPGKPAERSRRRITLSLSAQRNLADSPVQPGGQNLLAGIVQSYGDDYAFYSASAQSYSARNAVTGALCNIPVTGYEDNVFDHRLPLGFGLGVTLDLNGRFALESGLDYTLLVSEARQYIFTDPVQQRLQFIGIPLRVSCTLLRGAASFYAGAGAKAEFCLDARFGDQHSREHVQWSAQAFAGIDIPLERNVSLYFEPSAGYYFTETTMKTYRTEHPLDVTLRAGLRFHL